MDAAGNIVVSGTSMSSDFPQAGKLSSVISTTTTSYTFVSSLDVTGAVLRYSGFFGATLGANGGYQTRLNYVAFDPSGSAYLTGTTYDASFPITTGAYGGPIAAGVNETLYVAKIGKDGTVQYGASIPETSNTSGPQPIQPGGIAVDGTGGVVVTGQAGTGLPTTSGALATSFPNDPLGPGFAGFALKLNPAGSALLFSTYLPGTDSASGVALDGTTNIYVSGSTFEANLPVSSNALQPLLVTRGNVVDDVADYIFKLSGNGSQALAATYIEGTGILGGGGTYGQTLVLDPSGNVVIGCRTFSADLPLKNPFMSWPNPFGLSRNQNLYVAQLSSDLSTLQFGSFLDAIDEGSVFEALAVGPAGNIVVAGQTTSQIFPTTAGSLQPLPPLKTAYQGENFIASLDLSIAAPSLCYDTTSINLGTNLIGATATGTVNVTNCGNASLSLNSLVSSDPTVTATHTCNGISGGWGLQDSIELHRDGCGQ